MAQTLAQKILQAHTDDEIRSDGQIVQCRLSGVLANDITGPLAIKSFHGMGATKVFDKDKVFLVMDHFTPQKDIDSANQVMVSRRFAQEQGITHYYEGGDCGVEHTLLPERGLVGPGDVVIGADSHTCTYGGIGAFATGMGSTDIAAGMALGETWIKVPATIRVNITGTMGRWLRGKDLMLLLIKTIGVDGALYKALEFGGSVVDALPVEGRLTMANMAIEAGGKVGLFAVDELTGLIGAAALMRPTGFDGMTVKSIMKKFKDKNFAKGCSRDVITKGADMLGITVQELCDITLQAMTAAE